jgi:hypothetical protein
MWRGSAWGFLCLSRGSRTLLHYII